MHHTHYVCTLRTDDDSRTEFAADRSRDPIDGVSGFDGGRRPAGRGQTCRGRCRFGRRSGPEPTGGHRRRAFDAGPPRRRAAGDQRDGDAGGNADGRTAGPVGRRRATPPSAARVRDVSTDVRRRDPAAAARPARPRRTSAPGPSAGRLRETVLRGRQPGRAFRPPSALREDRQIQPAVAHVRIARLHRRKYSVQTHVRVALDGRTVRVRRVYIVVRRRDVGRDTRPRARLLRAPGPVSVPSIE